MTEQRPPDDCCWEARHLHRLRWDRCAGLAFRHHGQSSPSLSFLRTFPLGRCLTRRMTTTKPRKKSKPRRTPRMVTTRRNRAASSSFALRTSTICASDHRRRSRRPVDHRDVGIGPCDFAGRHPDACGDASAPCCRRCCSNFPTPRRIRTTIPKKRMRKFRMAAFSAFRSLMQQQRVRHHRSHECEAARDWPTTTFAATLCCGDLLRGGCVDLTPC